MQSTLQHALAVVAIVLCFCAAASTIRSEPLESEVQITARLEQWQFPAAKSKGKSQIGNEIVVGEFETEESFENVWTFYAKKFGSKHQYKSNLSSAESVGTTTDQFGVLMRNSDTRERTGVKTATLVRAGTEETVSVFISRGTEEHATYFTVVLELH